MVHINTHKTLRLHSGMPRLLRRAGLRRPSRAFSSERCRRLGSAHFLTKGPRGRARRAVGSKGHAKGRQQHQQNMHMFILYIYIYIYIYIMSWHELAHGNNNKSFRFELKKTDDYFFGMMQRKGLKLFPNQKTTCEHSLCKV